MSQVPPGPAPAVQQQTNGLGLAGFICSLIGLVLGVATGVGGLLSIVGLIMSLIALGREPRGFAIAGVILGLLGSCLGLILIFFLGVGLLALIGVGVAAIALSNAEQTEITSDMLTMAVEITQYEEQQGALPATLDQIDVAQARRIDPWGNAYEYHFIDEPPGFELISRGEDGQAGTEDDIVLSKLGESWTFDPRITIDSQTTDGGGAVRIRIGDRVIEVTGDGDGGQVQIDVQEPGQDEAIDAAPAEGAESGGDEPPPEPAEPATPPS
jgi:hypothetical protein